MTAIRTVRRVPTVLGLALALSLALTGCGEEETAPADGAATGETSSEATAPPPAPTEAEADAFLEATAAHVCEVQSAVYPDAEALDAAFAETPDYEGLGDDTVGQLQERLEQEADFSSALNDLIAKTCP